MNFESFVLAAATADLGEEPRARGVAAAVEFRMDLAEAPDDALAVYDGELPLIVTNRVVGEGGEAPDDPARLDRLREATAHPRVEAIDLELAAAETDAGSTLVEHARERGVSVVVSVHDFEATPPPDRLDSLLARATARGDVGKLAVTATTPGDVLPLLAATWRFASEGVPVATMAMGAAGRHSRAVAPLYGSAIGYAPIDPARATAPGQYDLETLAALVDHLR